MATKTFTDYRSAVLKVVHKTKNPEVFARYHWFSTATVANIIADNWKDNMPIPITAENVIAYIETLEN